MISELRKVRFRTKDKNYNSEMDMCGYFHKWVTYADENGSEEYALVEDLDGNMIETYTTYIRFINDPRITWAKRVDKEDKV